MESHIAARKNSTTLFTASRNIDTTGVDIPQVVANYVVGLVGVLSR